VSLCLTEETTLGLFFIQRYRFLTIDQFARIAGLNRATARNRLRILERHGLLGHFGNTGLNGRGKTPKVYFLTRKGWDILTTEGTIPPELVGAHKEVKVDARWSPQMYHRLRTVDVMIAAECAVRMRPHLSMVKTFLEYRRVKRGKHIARETTDFVAVEETTENKIVPDAAFILENTETNRRALFFVEMDMATERVVSFVLRDSRITIQHKFTQYDRYLKSRRYAQTYAAYGDFSYFTLLFVTLTDMRVEHIRYEMRSFPEELAKYYRLTTFDAAMRDFFGHIWKSRSRSDLQVYPLVREHIHAATH
jgi:hypothetical protein